MTVTFCNQCGFNNPPGMRFCGNCGSRLAVSEIDQGNAENNALFLNNKNSLSSSVAIQSVNPEMLGVFMGSGLAQRMQQAGLEASGRRRSVTILFSDLTGYTELAEDHDPEEIFDLIQQYFKLLVEAVYKYEGIVDKMTGDGLMALFGAPIAHENNAERAVRAALDMQKDVERLSQDYFAKLGVAIKMRVGLHAGSVIVGGIGSDFLMDYTAIGDTVNLARRIEESTEPGCVLASEAVFRQTRTLFDYAQKQPLTMKGIAKPVVTYQVLGMRAMPRSPRGLEGLRAPMVGRDQELANLQNALNALLNNLTGSFFLITGEAGLGKSRLITEFKVTIGKIQNKSSNKSRVRVLEGHSPAYRRSLSYWVFLEVLYNYLEVSSITPQAQVRERLVLNLYSALGNQASEALPYFEYLLSLPPSDPSIADRLRYLEAGQLRAQIFRIFRDLFIAEARKKPIVLILEDLHWADEASLDLLRYLLENLRQVPLLIIAISRFILDGAMAQTVTWAETHLPNQFHRLALKNLSLEQSQKLLTQLLSLPDIPASLSKHILNRAAGIPFYLEEILRMLIDNNFITREGEHWRLASEVDLESLSVPDNLQGLILARFDRLDQPTRLILQVAAIIGKDFNISILHAVIDDLNSVQIKTSINTLVEREFIQPQPSMQSGAEQPEFSNGSYTFIHILMSDAIYGTLLRRDRRLIHGKVAVAIETLYTDRLDEHVELLARHYSKSENYHQALQYLILAGKKAADGYLNIQARDLYTQALALLSKVPHTTDQIVQIDSGLGDVMVLTGEYPQAREKYLHALQEIQATENSLYARQLSVLQRKIGITFERQGDYNEALQNLADAQQTIAATGISMPVECALILNDTGWIHFRRGNLEEARLNLSQALSLLEGTDQYGIIASIYNRLAGVYYQKDDLDQASAFLQKSLVLREELGDYVAVARSYNNLGLLGWKSGKWELALENFHHAKHLHADLGDIEGMLELSTNLGLLQLDRGNIEKAGKHLQEALENAQQIGHTFVIGITYLYFSRLYLSIERWDSALNYAQQSLEALKELGDLDHMVDVYINIGQVWLGKGNLELAQQWGNDALLLHSQIGGGQVAGQAENRARALRLLGNIACLRNDLATADGLLKECNAIFRADGNQLEQGRTSQSLALLASKRGDKTLARVHLNEARLIFRQLGANQDLRNIDLISIDLSS